MEDFNYNNDLDDPFSTGDFNLLQPQPQMDHPSNNNNINNEFKHLEGQDISHGLSYGNGILPNNNNKTSKTNKTKDESPNKSKRKRAKGETLNILKREFNLNPSPTPQQRKDIAKLIGMPEKSVTIWFQNKRAKMKRKRLKEQNEAPNSGSVLTSPQQQHSQRSMSNNSVRFRGKNSTKQRRRKSKSKRRRYSSNNNNDNSSPMSNEDYDDDDGYDDEEEDDYDDYDDEDNESGYSRSSSIMNDLEDEREINFFDRVPLDINKNYYFIDVCSITVGTWNRMKSGSILRKKLKSLRNLRNLSPKSINDIMLDSTDLIVLISKKNFEINYFFSAVTNNSKILFRIFYPIASVTNCSISLESDEAITDSNATSRSNTNNRNFSDNTEDNDTTNKFSELKLTIDKSPNFAVYFLNENVLDTQNQWSICEDFSEGKQVNDAFIGGSNLPHILKGLQDSLRFMNSLILDYKSTNQIIPPPPPHSMHFHHQLPQQHESLDISRSTVPLNPQDLDMAISMSVPLNDPLSFQSLPGQQTQQTNILFNDNKNLSYNNVPDNYPYNNNPNNNNNNNNINIPSNHNTLQHQDSNNTSSSTYSSSLQFDRGNNNIHYNTNNHNQINPGLYDHDAIPSVPTDMTTNTVNSNGGDNQMNLNNTNTNTTTSNPNLNTHELENINLTPNSFFFDNQDYLSNTNNNNNSNNNNNVAISNNNDQFYAQPNYDSTTSNNNDIKNPNQKNNNLLDDSEQMSSNLHNLSPENYNGHLMNNNIKDGIVPHNPLNQHTTTDFF
ncbi:regulatory protein Pho2p [Monosporozyma unispora]|nr:hypothetical protein C6P44_005340 [Kazachstania unispora]